MTHPILGLLHPGAMGVTVGAAAKAGGARVVWASAGRSSASRERSERAGLEPLPVLADVVRQSQVIVSVCPPHAALDLAIAVADLGFSGTYIDANAVAPQTALVIAERIAGNGAGAAFVDGAIIGPPAVKPGTTRLYLSGARAAEVAELFGGALQAIAISDTSRSAASALKMAYAGYTKGTTALLVAVQALAEAEGVGQALRDEWALSQPGLTERAERAARNDALKAWRFAGEMGQIADSLDAAGLPGELYRGAAEIYQRLAEFKHRQSPPALAEVLAAVRERSGRQP